MYFFDKKTEYLIWKLEEGQAKGVGTVKFSVMDEVCRVEVTVTGCTGVTGTYPVYLLSGDLKSVLGEIALEKGKGMLYLRCKTGKLGDRAFPYAQVSGIMVDLKTEGYLEQKWLPVSEEKEEIEKEVEKVAPKKEFIAEKQKKEDPKEEQQAEEGEGDKKKREENTYQLYPEKWQQLCTIYPVVHPFGDGRAYLSIEPRDFVVLQERFQPMVQNSFLLHGFYHYKHLLLGRHKQEKNVQYYLGVPGVFYEKEKSAALYYGFESFEGAKSPATEGDFGYYLKKVLL